MNAARLWIIGGAVALAAILAAAWFLGVSPKLAEVAAAENQRLAAVELNAVNAEVLADLKEQFESLDSLEAQLAELQRAVPYELGASEFIQQVNGTAASLGVTVQEIAISEARAYGSPAPAGPPVAQAPAEDSAEGTADESDATTTAAPAPAPVGTSGAPLPPAALTDPRITAGNFVAVPTSVTVQGTYVQVLAAVKALQHGQRLYLVNGVALSPTDSSALGPDASYSAVLSGFVYVLLDQVALDELAKASESDSAG